MKIQITILLTFLLWVASPISALANGQTQKFMYSGAAQQYVVPDNIYSLEVKLWGAGGGISGGSAAFVFGRLSVLPSEVITVLVGGSAAGVYYDLGVAGRQFGGGGSAAGISDVLAGVGGGATSLLAGSVELATAAGGGGGTYVTIGAHNRRGGGFGGIDVGGNAEFGSSTGGTQSAGGSPNGAYRIGGDRVGRGAGGGGGHFGGGGGTNANPSQYSLFPGGGGSSYTANLSDLQAEWGHVGTAGVTLPGGANDADYVSGIGVGGAPYLGSGGKGMVVITANPAVPEPCSLTALFASTLILRRKRCLQRTAQLTGATKKGSDK